MKKISDTLKRILSNNALLSYGMKKKILNLSKLAELLKKDIEAETKKEISKQSLIMHLSRIQKNYNFLNKNVDFQIKNLSIIKNLKTISFVKNKKIEEVLFRKRLEIEKDGSFFSINETKTQISIIYDEKFDFLFDNYKNQFIFNKKNICGIKLNFNQKDFNTPGLIGYLIDKLSINGINIVEISSSFTEIIFYIDNKDTKRAFDIFY